MKNNFTRIIQIGIIVPDAEQTARNLKNSLGWHPWAKWETSRVPGRTYHGKEEDFVCKMLFYAFPHIEIEVIQPIIGKSCWQDYLSRHGKGIHHLLFDIDGSVNTEAELARHSIYVEQRGRALPFGENVYWAYLESLKQLGFVMEITNRCEYPLQTSPQPSQAPNLYYNPDQIGIVVRNAKATAEQWLNILGWPVQPLSPSSGTVYRGTNEPSAVLSACYPLPNIAVALNQPVAGHSFEQDYLDRHGEGIHYIQFRVQALEAMKAWAHKQGVCVIQEGITKHEGIAQLWVYLDTIDLFGFHMKIVCG